MRLLDISDADKPKLTKDFIGEDVIPSYAILSHTWSAEEVLFDDLVNDTGHEKAGYDKIRFCAQQARRDGLQYCWVDTCCINKKDSVELQEAINSMFRWYQDAARCYTYLSDVSTDISNVESGTSAWEPAFRKSRWFTRSWCLQELIAPRIVIFFSRERKRLGDKHELRDQIHEITSIPVSAIAGTSLQTFTIDERLSWSNRRDATRKEDKAYSLLGLCGIYMPLIYGEGQENAFRRLRKEIDEAAQGSCQQRKADIAALTKQMDSSSITPASYYIPFPRNRYFVGRTDELEILKQRLIVDQDCQSMSIVGLGGMGKTQIALQFAYFVKEALPDVSIFWMPAVSMELFEHACSDIVQELNLKKNDGDDVKELVKQHLSTKQAGRWLVVLDNADDQDIVFETERSKGIIEYLPESDQGITLFTTRVQDIAVSLTRGDVLELESMSREDAVKFLEKSLIKKDLLRDQAATMELLDELTCLPLAIAQAAAYLNVNRSTITKYLRLLRSTEQDIIGLMSKEFRDTTRYKGAANAVAMTWVVSFSQLQERDPGAAELLSFISTIEWKAIPRSLLPNLGTDERTEEAIGTLCGYSFLSSRQDPDLEEKSGEVEWYDLHRLVHLATAIWIGVHGNPTAVMAKAIDHVAKVFPKDVLIPHGPWIAYIPHTLRLMNAKKSVESEGRVILCLRISTCLHFDSRIKEAITWAEEAIRLGAQLELSKSYQMMSRHYVASFYRDDGQVKKAIEMFESIVEVNDKDLKIDGWTFAESQYELATTLLDDGEVKRAISIYENILAEEEKAMAETEVRRLVCQRQLGHGYVKDGQIKRGVTMLEHVVPGLEQFLNGEHNYLLIAQWMLADAYTEDGQGQKALPLLQHIATVFERIYPEENEHRLCGEFTFAKAFFKNGQTRKALSLLEHVVAVRERINGEDHRHRLASTHWLAKAYLQDGQVKKALSLIEHVVSVEAQSPKEETLERLKSEHLLAEVYMKDGQLEKALPLLERVVEGEVGVFKEDDPERIASAKLLERLHTEMGISRGTTDEVEEEEWHDVACDVET